MNWHAHVTVATVVYRQNKYLLVKELDNGRAVYNQPAGHLEADETLVDAAIRETQEETGWQVEVVHLIGISRYIAPSNQVTYIRFTFAAKPIQEFANAQLDDGIIEAEWLSKDQILERAEQLRSPLVLNDIERFERGDQLPLSCIFDHPSV